MNSITLSPKNSIQGEVTHLPSSKSISNRVLVLNALAGNVGKLHNLSDANDTQLMQRMVLCNDEIINVEDAGTVMRFLTAYFAISGKTKTLTGTARMKERPIGILVDSLRLLGADIDYLEKDGYPPLRIKSFQDQKTNTLQVRGDVSSQFISALMMIAPGLPKGLTIEITGHLGSKPYIDMTASLMKGFGAKVNFDGRLIQIEKQVLSVNEHTVEGDWSAASYWFGFAALCKEANLILPNMALRSLQGDRVVVDMMENLGVACEPRGSKLHLRKKDHMPFFSWDFTHCPDLAQTIAVVCAAKGIEGSFKGLESLRIKETDRIAALQNELAKINAQLIEEGDTWRLVPSIKLPDKVSIHTYHDHRMAMAFAPLAGLMQVEIEDPAVTRKSYPKFWDDVKRLGILVNVV
ncbi:3-phosphoshikimate 1-carboxyvinyltransferase [Chryseotalea sanaruensis]|uniref:3-phosphoshikimate 1-carboxyvinyltransferase n=1 Tax=Chryseotalea sanaruensis TaxID=2482724 RepID=A0A401UBT6_9BACT|nr:3-phosphoshikimate 1-carboxyvinyltransferase [Chryseotalea sanaruensis]GCC52324.1 3-phosphoshikimate 1-carboxyvinyltransferase [Chryseotalea sanaruensis]